MSLPVFFSSPRRSHTATVASSPSRRLFAFASPLRLRVASSPSRRLFAFAPLIKMCAAVCALPLLLALPSYAQFGDPNYYSHEWVVTYESHGTNSYAYLGSGSNTTSYTGPWPAGSNGGNSSASGTGDVNRASQGTVTATLTWYPSNGDSLLDPPDKTIYIQETATAQEMAGSWYGPVYGPRPDMAGSVDDGWGDPVTASGFGFGQVLTRTGTRLIQRDGSSGKIVLDPVSLSAATPTTGFASGQPDWIGNGWAIVSLQVQRDNRNVFITSNFPSPTYRKGAVDALHQTGRWENKRASSGSLTDDTVVPGVDGTHAIYTPNYPGSWGNDSTYGWQASLPNSSQQTLSETGTFNSTSSSGSQTIPTFEGIYHNPPALGGTSDTISLFLRDGVDSATASNTYTIKFHDTFEPKNMPPDGPPYKVMGPDPEASSFVIPPPSYPWQLVTDRNNAVVPPLIGPQGGNAAFNFGGTVTAGYHVDGGIGITVKDIVTIQGGGGGDWSKSTDQSISINPTPALKQLEQTWAISRLSVNRMKGHLDIYATNGYVRTSPWYTDTIVTTDYSYIQPYASSRVTPSAPKPGWNPPGY